MPWLKIKPSTFPLMSNSAYEGWSKTDRVGVAGQRGRERDRKRERGGGGERDRMKIR